MARPNKNYKKVEQTKMKIALITTQNELSLDWEKSKRKLQEFLWSGY